MSGRGTSAGVLFQSEVGAYAAALLLTERPLSRLGDNLPGKPLKIFMESPSAVDDVNVVTDRGFVYFQVKTSLSLSDNPASELGSVFDQFVRQYLQGLPDGSKTREMDLSRDRLVLVVRENAPATVRNDLREALSRNRTGAATALPVNLKNALDSAEKLIAASWMAEQGTAITPGKSQKILKLCAVAVLDQSQKKIATEALTEVVKTLGEETALFKLLSQWAVEAAQNGTGGERGAILRYLQGQIAVKEPPSFQSDVAKLVRHSQEVVKRLERFTKINTDSEEISFSRPVSAIVLAGAKTGSLALTGDPGSGKSGIMHDLSKELSKDSFVVTLTVENSITNLDVLKEDIGLEHPLLEVLKNIPLEAKGFLILDALDATRGGTAESTYKKLIEEVSLIPNWQVVASVRTFDLKLGVEWKKLFRGTAPNPTFSEASFRNVRHVHVTLLGEAEINEIEAKSPSLKTALAAGGTKMATLAKNPFNLSLIGELISGGVPPASLSEVGTRSELLSRYWEERLGDLGLPATVALKKYVDIILSERSIDLPETDVPMDASVMIQQVQARGVLVTEPTRRIAFRHHILFDFAVSRLILEPDTSKAIPRLSKTDGGGLLIAPSLEYWLEHLKQNFPAPDYWKLMAMLMGSEETDPVIRVEVARIAVQSVVAGEDLSELAKVLSGEDPGQKRAIIQLAGTLSTYDAGDDTVESWAKMISEITDIAEPYQLQSIKVIIYTLSDSALTPAAMSALGKASRTLFDEISKNDRLIYWLSAGVIPLVAKTFPSDPESSNQRLEQIFNDERFKKYGYFEVPALADQALALAAYDDDLVTKLYRRVFAGGEFSNEHATTLGSPSWIMGFRSNAAQDFHMAEYALSTNFLKLLEQSPKTAIRALGAAIDVKERRWQIDPDVEYQVSYGSGESTFKDDHSAFWAFDDDFGGDGEENIYRIFQQWAETADDSLLKDAPGILLAESGKALAWKALLEIGIKRPEILGTVMWNSAIDTVVLSSMNTRQAAIRLIVATYPLVSEQQRRDAEAQVLAYDFAQTRDPEYYSKHIITSVFDAIGEANLASTAAKEYLKKSLEEKIEVIDPEPVEKRKILVALPDEKPKMVAAGEVEDTVSGLGRAIRTLMAVKPDGELAGLLWAKVEKFIGLIDQISGDLDSETAGTLAKALGKALKADWIPAERKDEVIARLISLSKHSSPTTDGQTEADFARAAVWSGNSVRVVVAEILGGMTKVPAIWPKVRDRYIEIIFSDPHPAVRMQAIIRILGLWDTDRNALWDIADKFVDSESNSSVLGYGAGELARLRSAAVEKIEPLFIKLAGKKVSKMSGESAVPATIAYFAVLKGLSGSKSIFQRWIADFKDNESAIHSALFSLRDYFAAGFAPGQEQLAFSRKNVIAVLWELIEVLEPFIVNWPTDREPTAKEMTALKIFTAIGQQFYFAIGHREGVSLSIEQQRVLLREYGPLISKLTTLGSPKTVHDCLQVLERFIAADSELCFELISEAMLRTSGVAKYEYEPMGAKLFVNLVGVFLADYRYIFADPARRKQLTDCLAVFVDAGWPEARRLFQQLPDLR
ncbi:hypothetical protein ACS126_16520 [Sphingobacterium lactis]|uniref:hypothetical protein n=1 Tax=Sphingobacterium lactis TaxID=797291 RepID=UPI003EC8B107